MYTNNAQVEAELKAYTISNPAAPSVTEGKKYITQAINFVCERIDTETHQTFAPIRQTTYLDSTQDNVDWYRNMLFLGFPLLAAEEVNINGTALTLWDGVAANKSAADYIYRNRAVTPYYYLQGLQQTSTWSPLTYGGVSLGWGDITDAIEITGIWGYRRNYAADGWKNTTDEVENSPLSASDTSITVNDVDGVGWDGTTPRFSPGQLLQIESEWIQVVDTDTDNNTLTVIRGVRGSTAASHDQDTQIDVWNAEPDIQRAAIRWVAYLFARRAVFQQVTFDGLGTVQIQFPPDIPPEVNGQLADYRLELARSVAV